MKHDLDLPKWIWIIGLGAFLSLGGYLLVSQLIFKVGFPLDDSWIHQTYARNLIQFGQWAYLPGQPSAGSTAPLWTVLLSIGYLLKIPTLAWTFFAEWIILWAVGWISETVIRSNFPNYSRIPLVGIFFVFEWHLVWAAGSGMETLLFSLIALIVIVLLMRTPRNWLLLGLLIGVSTWLRPDGITLLGPALFVAWVTNLNLKSRVKSSFWVAGGFITLFAPYLLFNQFLAGSWWPNTFYAKQVEYAALQQLPFLNRLLSEASLPLIGAGSVLVPGIAYYLWSSYRQRDWQGLASFFWVVGYIGLYAWRLPVTYQHGRYILPTMPILFLLGLTGYGQFIRTINRSRWRWTIGQTWKLTIAMLLVGFWIIGSQSYGRDVAVIESEMVDTARWISQNTPSNSVIAAHDIGALGFFGNRQIIDMAGLISTEVIPIMRDEADLEKFLNRKQVDYLMTFPDWYTRLGKDKVVVFKGKAVFAPNLGQPNMQVYAWKSPTN